MFSNAGFVKTERLAGNVGYLRFDAFAPSDDAAPRMAAATEQRRVRILEQALAGRSNGGVSPATSLR